jgi:hypothetical protein
MANSDEEALAARRKLYMERDFDPGHSSMPFEIRLALAAEYVAYQLGQSWISSLKQPSKSAGVLRSAVAGERRRSRATQILGNEHCLIT